MEQNRRSPVMVLLLSILTCGIYYLYWIYQVSASLKPFNRNDSMAPGLELLLCIICFPYVIYWNYKYGRIIFEAQQEVGMPYPEENSLLYLILAIFGFGVVGACIMQASLNKLCDYEAQNL